MNTISSTGSRDAASGDTSRGRGRPRDVGVDQRILHATIDVLGASGYAGMSMDAVAASAGVSKPTIYRRWPTKIELATAAIATMVIDDPPTTTDDVWAGLHAELVLFGDALSRGRGVSITATLLAHEEQEPELMARYREHVAKARRDRFRGVLRRGLAAGQLPADVDIDLIVNLLIGYYYSTHIGGEARPADWPRVCVDFVRRSVDAVPATPASPPTTPSPSTPTGDRP